MGHLLKREENTGERLSLLEEEKTTLPLKTSRGKISSSSSTKSVGFICALSLGAFALSASSSSKKNSGAYNIDAAFKSGSPMSLLGVSDQIDVMKSLIVDTCGKSALSDYEKTYSLLPGEKAASEMGEREEGDDKKYAKADAFLSKLKNANGGKKEDQEDDDEDLEIDSSKNTDTFLREFNDMQKRMKETKKFANEEEDDLEEAKEDSSSDGERTVEEREDARFEKKLTKTLAKDDIDEEDEEEEKHRPQSSRKKQSSSSDQKSSSRSSASEDEDHRRPSKNFSGYREKFHSDADDEVVASCPPPPVLPLFDLSDVRR